MVVKQVQPLYNALINFYGDATLTDEEKDIVGGELKELNETQEDVDAHPMESLLNEQDYDLELPKRGQILSGTIARVTDADILVDVGAKSEGVISSREVESLPDERLEQLKVGEEVKVYVLRSGGRDGTIRLSITRAEEEKDWQEAEDLSESSGLFEGKISGYNKGGLIVRLGRLRGFVPASQVSLSRRRRAQGDTPEQRWGEMLDEPIITKVIEVDRRRNRLILSERAASREARDALKEKLISELEVGEIRQGRVISLADFGAFVDIGGADGLVHISELSWKRVSHPKEVVKVGDEVKVKVLNVDPERNRISLSLREVEDSPWDMIAQTYGEGQLVEGTVTKLTKFGAFASLVGSEEYDIEGLIHISELADHRIEHPREVVSENEKLTLRIVNVEPERRRIGLSLRRVDSPEYAEQDWQSAMQEVEALDEEGIEVHTEAVEDFDASLEEEQMEPHEVGVESETSESEEGVETLAESDVLEVPQDAISEAAELEEDVSENETRDPGGGQEDDV
jgi:small subunit ribosomal protein S1